MSVRPPPRNHWLNSLPADRREEMDRAWQEHRCCADCLHWEGDEEGNGSCGNFRGGAFLTPEDYTCLDFTPAPPTTNPEHPTDASETEHETSND